MKYTGAGVNQVLIKSDIKLDSDSVASLDSRLNPSHLVWSQHKSAQLPESTSE